MSKSHNVLSQVPHQRLHEALDSVRDEIAAVPLEKLSVINLDIEAVSVSVLGCLPEVRALRPRIVALPEFEMRCLDNLETYTLAMVEAHTLYLTTVVTPESIETQVRELAGVRDVLDADATALAKRSLIDGHRLAELRGGNSFRNVVFDVFLLVAVLREQVKAVAGKSAIDVEYLDSAEDMAQKVANQIGLREQAPVVSSAAAETRQRAFTLFVQAYDQVRRAVGYLRWNEGDADSITPSLFAGRGGRKKTDVPAPVPPNTPAPAATPPAAALPGGDPFTSH